MFLITLCRRWFENCPRDAQPLRRDGPVTKHADFDRGLQHEFLIHPGNGDADQAHRVECRFYLCPTVAFFSSPDDFEDVIQIDVDAIEAGKIRESVKGFSEDPLCRLHELHDLIGKYVVEDTMWMPRDQPAVRMVARAGHGHDGGCL